MYYYTKNILVFVLINVNYITIDKAAKQKNLSKFNKTCIANTVREAVKLCVKRPVSISAKRARGFFL